MNLEATLRTEAAMLQRAFNLTADEARRRVLATHRLYDPVLCVEIDGNSFVPETRLKTEQEFFSEIGGLLTERENLKPWQLLRRLQIRTEIDALTNGARTLGYFQ